MKNMTVIQPRSGEKICPVISWGKIVRRVLSYKGTSINTYVNTILIGKKTHFVKASEMYDQISNTVDNMTGLGFTGADVGNHSIRSALAMDLYL